MNQNDKLEILKESARFEENVARLYLLLSRLYPEDSEFWLQLYVEEKNHAGIFRSFLEGQLPLSLVPDELFSVGLSEVRVTNLNLEKDLSGFISRHKSKLSAYEYALSVESKIVEANYQETMIKESDSESLFFVQRMNREECNHRDRIMALVDSLKTGG